VKTAKSPCRGCDDKSVKITTREFKALVLASDRGREALSKLAGAGLEVRKAQATIEKLNARNGALEAELEAHVAADLSGKILPKGEPVMLHRGFGEPWEVCPNGWAGQECAHELDYEHRRAWIEGEPARPSGKRA